LLPEPPDPHPPQTATTAARAAAAGTIDRLPSTRPTLTSGDFGAIYDSL
jgi:hypothetical protein